MSPIRKIDRALSVAGDGLVRRMSRREALGRGAKGAGATLAALAVGDLIAAQSARAAECSCGPSRYCDSCPDGSGGVYCNSSRTRCTSGDCPGYCPWGDGQWVSCHGCGPGSGSYRVCSDCRTAECANVCTCLSTCFCTGCNSVNEMLQDMRERGLSEVAS